MQALDFFFTLLHNVQLALEVNSVGHRCLGEVVWGDRVLLAFMRGYDRVKTGVCLFSRHVIVAILSYI